MWGSGGRALPDDDATRSAGSTGAARRLLLQIFGHSAFRPPQEAIVEHVIGGGHAMVVMPTGGGKSLCYQLPALVRPGLGVVVSPLIALMQDQVRALTARGIRAAALNSSQALGESVRIEREIRRGEVDLLYVAPERLMSESCLGLLDQTPLSLVAVDEAHCVAQWGHDFRPEYRALERLSERFPGVPRLALTATADADTRREIRATLGLENAAEFIGGFDRPNLRLLVAAKDQPKRQILDFLHRHRGEAGIIYCLSRARAEAIALWLDRAGIKALAYHAGLDARLRAERQEIFRQEPDCVMVATVAFGLGIDKPDIRFVIHLDLPKGLESYYQEIGRAGRDGLAAETLLLYGIKDVVQMQALIEGPDVADSRKDQARARLDALTAFAEGTDCRRQMLLGHFGEQLPAPCGNCDTCLAPPRRQDRTVEAQKLLSCVYRTGQRFGVTHLVDVLKGRATARVLALRHDQLSTFGIGQELSADGWKALARQCVSARLLTVDRETGSVLLGPQARPVLRGEQPFMARADDLPAPRPRRWGRGR